MLDLTAMFLVVLFNLTLVFFINELCKENRKSAIVSYVSCLFLVYHFVMSFNLNYVLEWKSNADVKEMLSDLEKIKSIPKQKKSINICAPLSFVQSINYYRAVNNLTWINTVERSAEINSFEKKLDNVRASCNSVGSAISSEITVSAYTTDPSPLAPPTPKFLAQRGAEGCAI